MNSVRRRTAREATIVDAIAAGTLKMIDITAFRFSSMNTVAIRLATKLGRNSSANEHESNPRELYSRDNEKDETIMEDQIDKPTAAAPRKEQFVRSKAQDQKVETHRVDERGCKNGIVRLRNDASSRWNPRSADQETVQQERPVAQNDSHERDDDVQRL